MGQATPAVEQADLYVYALGTAPIEQIDVIRSGSVVATLPGDGQDEIEASAELQDLRPGEFVYVRIEQAGDGLAWSSPVYIE